MIFKTYKLNLTLELNAGYLLSNMVNLSSNVRDHVNLKTYKLNRLSLSLFI